MAVRVLSRLTSSLEACRPGAVLRSPSSMLCGSCLALRNDTMCVPTDAHPSTALHMYLGRYVHHPIRWRSHHGCFRRTRCTLCFTPRDGRCARCDLCDLCDDADADAADDDEEEEEKEAEKKQRRHHPPAKEKNPRFHSTRNAECTGLKSIWKRPGGCGTMQSNT